MEKAPKTVSIVWWGIGWLASAILLASLALARAFWKATTEIVAKIPMMAITTKSSMRVKAFLEDFIWKQNNV